MTFKAVNWTPNELVGEAKMDTLVANADWLYKNTPRTLYTLPGGIRRVEGIKIAAGRIIIYKDKTTDTATVEVRFGNYFSSRCEPIITTGIISEGQPRIFCVYNGIGQTFPDHRGFQATINIAAGTAANDNIARSFAVSWQAMGY
jgi:hypothetical protein